jgi:hypothetical protein
MLVRIDEPMRVAPGGHVIELKPGEEVDGVLAEHLVATRCNVTVLEEDAVSGPDTGDGEVVSLALSASLESATDVTDTPIADPDPDSEPVKAPAVKPAKPGKATAK